MINDRGLRYRLQKTHKIIHGLAKNGGADLRQGMFKQFMLDAFWVGQLLDGTFNPFENYDFTGTMRPVYPLSPTRKVPEHIPRPDYVAADGMQERPSFFALLTGPFEFQGTHYLKSKLQANLPAFWALKNKWKCAQCVG